MIGTRARTVLVGVTAVAAGLVMGALVAALAGKSPVEFLRVYGEAAFSDAHAWSQTLKHVTPVMLTGLSIALAYRGGLFNVGAEGQLIAGGLAAAALGIWAPVPTRWLHVPLALAGGTAAGAAVAWVPGWLRARRDVHEVVTTIMMNYALLHAAEYLINGPMNAGLGAVSTRDIAATAQLPVLVGEPGTRTVLGAALPLAIVCVIVATWLIRRTRFGYELRAVGGNAEAAALSGIRVARVRVRTMLLAGAVSGLAGALLVSGDHHHVPSGFSAGYGFDGIAVAFLAASQTWAVPLTSLLLGSLRSAEVGFAVPMGLSRHLITIIQSTIIFAVGTRTFLAGVLAPRRPARTETPHG
jgi:simple sugar transport system permease protein